MSPFFLMSFFPNDFPGQCGLDRLSRYRVNHIVTSPVSKKYPKLISKKRDHFSNVLFLDENFETCPAFYFLALETI